MATKELFDFPGEGMGEGKDSENLPLKDGDELQKQYGSSDTAAQPPRPSPPRKWWSPLWWYRNPPPFEKWWASLLSCLMFWKRKGPPPDRIIYINDPVRNGGHFCSNRISTTKYNILTFLPKFLFDQFRRYANLFFLFIVILQQFPGVSPTGRFTTIVPLSLILLVVAIKEIIEDVRRFRADNQVNRSKVEVVRDEKLRTVHWTQVVVGDIVRVENKRFFPADLLFLSSSDEQGLCYIETSNLDGETNLKIRQAHIETMNLTTAHDLGQMKGEVECEGPNSHLYEFTGNIKLAGHDWEPIQSDQILLRGAQLRNTQWIYGFVLYTGHDTKLLQNSTAAPLKRSNMDRVTNRQVIFLFFVLLVLAFISSIGATIWINLHQNDWYLFPNTNSEARRFFVFFLSFLVLYNNLVPISLIVTLEIVKLIQVYFINYDLDMYDASTDTPALARNSNLNEELGQVKYIFSDKTGTLTENVMEFKKCTVAGQIYSTEPTDSSEDPYTILSLQEALTDRLDSQSTLVEFLKVLALCHTVIPEREREEVVYRASSPDEGALVKAAKLYGVTLETRKPKSVVIDVRGKKEEYEILNLLEFNSARKRMSVIVRTPDGTIKLLCKGADTVIYERLVPNEPFSKVTEKHLEYFAYDGLRTLCVAETTIDEAAYQKWNSQYVDASTTLSDREKELDNVAELIEKDLHLLGATAIEDKLQKDVPESIATLRSANIKVWVLTGDKQETAINIGYASRQLVQDMKLLIINETSREAVEARISDYLGQLGTRNTKREYNVALIINGKSLGFALDDSIKEKFLELSLACKSVICCRVSPVQKADVVKLVKNKVKDSITLAIGDGANDVSMIQAAHVGVGISGKEGLQATLASDYAIAQFRFLVKLLLVHGAWNYNRLALVILFSFYKNICLYIIEFWFAFWNGFSGQPLFERWTIGVYNVLFTSLVPFALGVFNQDISAKVRLQRPSLYRPSQENKGFNSKLFWQWVGLSMYHSLLIFLATYFLLSHETPFENGKVFGLWYVGNTVYTAVVVTVNLKGGFEADYWTWLTHLSVWGSIVVWILFLLVYSHFWPTFPLAVEMVGQDFALFRSATFYALFVLTPIICNLPEFIWRSFQKTLCPTEIDKVRNNEIAKTAGRCCRGTDDYVGLDTSLSVSYSSGSPGAQGYGDGLEDSDRSSLTFLHAGYAFSQEDHGKTKKGSRVQRRDIIRMYDTSSPKEKLV